tara:strand:- start:844 stop:1704 length:861 start_codon:yes stop_codon:yes gene_type:complete
MPKYSICIPTFNRSEVVINALNSATNQENQDFEILIVDNNSDENHKTFLEEYLDGASLKNLTYIRNSHNIGMFKNWDKCIDIAKGEYISILSDDDLLAPNFLTNIDCVVERYPNSAYFVKKNEFEILQPFFSPRRGKPFDVSNVRRLNRNIFKWFNGIGPPAGFVFPKSVGSSIRFNAKQYPSADYDFFIKISKALDIFYLDEVLAYVGIGLNDSLNKSTIYGFIEKDKLLRKKCGQNSVINNVIEVFQLNNYLLSNGHRDRKNIFAVIIDLFFRLLRKLIFKWYC